MPENVPLYNDLTVNEFLLFMSELKLVKRKDRKTEINKIIDATGLESVRNKLIRNLSKGYKQRTSLAAALIGNPPILILDEPTVGLDPLQVVEIRNLIKSLGKDHTVLISSHILAEISEMCNKLIIINNGKIVKIDEISNIEKQLSSQESEKEITFIVEEENDSFTKLKNEIKNINSIKEISEENNKKTYLLKYTGQDDIRKLVFKKCVEHNITIIESKKKELSLEDIFISLTEKGGK